MAGAVVAAVFAALEGAIVVGGVSALGAALTTIGVPDDVIVKYETGLKADRYVLMMHGDAAEIAKARAVLQVANTELITRHRLASRSVVRRPQATLTG
jgi:hypothetical protein